MRFALGRKGESDRKILTYLDRFLMAELKPGKPITAEIAERWFKSMEHLSIGTRLNRMSICGSSVSYLSNFDPRTCIIHQKLSSTQKPPCSLYLFAAGDVL